MIENPNREDMLLLQLRHRLELEIRGLKGQFSAYAMAKRHYKLSGSRERVLRELNLLWEEVLERRRKEAKNGIPR